MGNISNIFENLENLISKFWGMALAGGAVILSFIGLLSSWVVLKDLDAAFASQADTGDYLRWGIEALCRSAAMLLLISAVAVSVFVVALIVILALVVAIRFIRGKLRIWSLTRSIDGLQQEVPKLDPLRKDLVELRKAKLNSLETRLAEVRSNLDSMVANTIQKVRCFLSQMLSRAIQLRHLVFSVLLTVLCVSVYFVEQDRVSKMRVQLKSLAENSSGQSGKELPEEKDLTGAALIASAFVQQLVSAHNAILGISEPIRVVRGGFQAPISEPPLFVGPGWRDAVGFWAYRGRGKKHRNWSGSTNRATCLAAQ